MKKYFAYIWVLISITSCNTGSPGKQTDAVTIAEENIQGKVFDAAMKVLASDELEGRKPFTIGETKTIAYLQDAYSAIGLMPGNDTSFLQKVPLVDVKSVPEVSLTVQNSDTELSFHYLDDYVAASRRLQDESKLEKSEIVFVGYGIVAPEFGWNDYAGIDVKGKTVMVLVNDPGFFDSTLFKGKTMTYYGRWTYKFEEAARQGAAGVFIVHDTRPASYDWPVVRSGWSKSKLYLNREDRNMGRAAVEGWVTMASAKKIMALAKKPDSLLQAAGKKGFNPVPLNLNASIRIKNTFKESYSQNFIALLPGTEKKDEYIIYTAHWDHFGKGEPIDGDSIYNGAADNASGAAALLEIATAFSKLKEKPRRSIVFLNVTAEEQGLLGSEYYTANPVYPIKQTIANINLDVLQPFGKMKDVIIVGKGQSELDDLMDAAAKQQNRYTRAEPDPSGGWYFRSDHFNFAKVGVPSLYIENGEESLQHEPGWGLARKKEYNTNRYHRPTDEYNKDWDISGIVQDIQLLFNVGYTLSEQNIYPKWKQGSEFKSMRDN